MNTKDRKKALATLKKFVVAKQSEEAHDEILAHVTANIFEVSEALGYAPEHVVEVLASESAAVEAHIAALELFAQYLATFPDSSVVLARGESKQVTAALTEYLRSNALSMMAALEIEIGPDGKDDELFKFADHRHSLVIVPERIARWRRYVTRRFVETISHVGRDLSAAARDEELEHARQAAKDLGARVVDGDLVFDAAKMLATCLLGSRNGDTTAFLSNTTGVVYIPTDRLRDVRALKKKELDARVRVERGRAFLQLSWPNAMGRRGFLRLFGKAPARDARVVMIEPSAKTAEVAA